MWGTRVDVAIALVAALLGHAALAALLFFGLPLFQSEPEPVPTVEALIITDVEGRLGRIQREQTEAAAAKRAEAVRQQREREAQAQRRAAEQLAAQRAAEQAEAEAKARQQAEERARE